MNIVAEFALADTVAKAAVPACVILIPKVKYSMPSNAVSLVRTTAVVMAASFAGKVTAVPLASS